MNLHAIAGPIVAAVNPWVTGQLSRSTGYTTAASGKRTPTYAAADDVQIQVQPLTGREIAHMDSLNIGGVLRAVYVQGHYDSLVRSESKGGDIFVFDSKTWLVVNVLEQWPDWVKAAVQLQV